VQQSDPPGPLQIVQRVNNVRNIRFEALPGGLITKPTLVWLIDAKKEGEHLAKVYNRLHDPAEFRGRRVRNLVQADVVEREFLSLAVLAHVQPDDRAFIFAGDFESQQVPVQFQRPLQVGDVEHDVGDIHHLNHGSHLLYELSSIG